VSLAARGTRKMDAHEEQIRDEWLRGQLRRQALKVYVESILLGLALAILLIVLPL